MSGVHIPVAKINYFPDERTNGQTETPVLLHEGLLGYQEVSIKRPPLKEPKSAKWGGARFASIQMEVLNAPPYKIFRNRGVRVSLPFPFFHCFVETPLKIPPKNFRLRRAWGVRVSLPTIFPK